MKDIEPSLRVGRAITNAVDNLVEHSREPITAPQVVAGMIDATHVLARTSGFSREQYSAICGNLWRLAEGVEDKVVSGLMVLAAQRAAAQAKANAPTAEEAETTVVDPSPQPSE